jgi:hypothetical protein
MEAMNDFEKKSTRILVDFQGAGICPIETGLRIISRPVSRSAMLFILLGSPNPVETPLIIAAEENDENQEEEQQLGFGIEESTVTENNHQDQKEKEKAAIDVIFEACHVRSLLRKHMIYLVISYEREGEGVRRYG